MLNDDGTLTISPSNQHKDGIFMVLVDGEESDDAEINGNNKVTVPCSQQVLNKLKLSVPL